MPTKRKIIKYIGLLLFLIVLITSVYTLINYRELKADLQHEIQLYGPLGLLVGGFIVDIVAGPIGTEVPVIGGIIAGIDVPTVLVMTYAGSILASLITYLLGYFFGEVAALQYMSRQKYDKWKRLFMRHRRITMSLGALTPVPYVVVCVISGVFKTRLWEYLIFAVGARFIRIAGAAYIVLLFQGRI